MSLAARASAFIRARLVFISDFYPEENRGCIRPRQRAMADTAERIRKRDTVESRVAFVHVARAHERDARRKRACKWPRFK